MPLLWRSEFRSILSGAVKHKACSLDRAIAIAEGAENQLRGREFSVESSQVLSLSAESGCSRYDSECVALARNLGVRLVTNDRQILRAFPAETLPLAHFSWARVPSPRVRASRT